MAAVSAFRRALLLGGARRWAPRTTAMVPVRMATTGEYGTILAEPAREAGMGMFKMCATVLIGLSVGGYISKNMAAFLEENELFVPEDDDDDDD